MMLPTPFRAVSALTALLFFACAAPRDEKPPLLNPGMPVANPGMPPQMNGGPKTPTDGPEPVR